MARQFLKTVLTPSVLAAQKHCYGRSAAVGPAQAHDPLTDDERSLIESRDSFYMATVTENGWPYVQHRGGIPGFLRVVSPTQLAFADYEGNHQLISSGNLAANDRVAIFLMDYPQRQRLKILGHARVEDARLHPELVEHLVKAEDRARVERLFIIDVLSYDWNCPKHITPRFTATEVEVVIAPMRQRIVELEAQLKAAKDSNTTRPSPGPL